MPQRQPNSLRQTWNIVILSADFERRIPLNSFVLDREGFFSRKAGSESRPKHFSPKLLKSHLLRPQGQRESPGNNAKKRNLNLSRHRPASVGGNSAHQIAGARGGGVEAGHEHSRGAAGQAASHRLHVISGQIDVNRAAADRAIGARQNGLAHDRSRSVKAEVSEPGDSEKRGTQNDPR